VEWQIRRAVRTGRAVEDPEWAAIAASRADYVSGMGERSLRRIQRLRWLFRLLPLLCLVLVVLRILDEGFNRANAFQIGWLTVFMGGIAALPATVRRSLRRAQAAAAANRALAATRAGRSPDAA
jgi:hypothetical protein